MMPHKTVAIGDQDLGTISGAALQQYLVSGRAAGADVHAALAAAGIDEKLANNPDARIPGEQFERMLEHLARASGDPLFGLNTSQFIQPGSYSIMGYIAMSAGTIGEAVSRMLVYEKLVGDMGTSQIEPDGSLIRVVWNCRHSSQPARRHLIENVLASWVHYTRWLADADLRPEYVMLEHDAPDAASIARYEEIFHCPVRFRQKVNALVTRPDVLMHPLRQPDQDLLKVLESHASQRLSELGLASTTTQRVREAIRACIEKTGLPRKERVAEMLAMNPRTLLRRLQEEDTTYQDVLDALRRELAMDLLRTSRLTQSDIAARLGFAEIRSFQRCFKRWTGSTPGDYREKQLREQQARS
ncbi:MAG: AraC family transcriptional regulator [Pseudomonadota bacterium]